MKNAYYSNWPSLARHFYSEHESVVLLLVATSVAAVCCWVLNLFTQYSGPCVGMQHDNLWFILLSIETLCAKFLCFATPLRDISLPPLGHTST